MCQLPRLNFLDTVELSARNKQIAEATMIKKKMYYNMRIKTIKRDVHSRIRHAETIRNHAENHMETSVSALVRQKKEIERFVKKLECINSCLRDRYTAVHRMDQDLDRLRISLRCTSEMNVARLMLELETGGNIRLEDGKPTDAWFGSCVELVRSRFCLPDLQKFGICDIRINRVTRINNRFLRNRFQTRLEEVLVTPDKKVKDNVSKKGVTVPNNDVEGERDSDKTNDQEQINLPSNICPVSTLETAMEYLFYTQSTSLEDQLLRSPADSEQLFIAENGFCGYSGLSTTDFGAAIKLTNSIALLDTPRVTATLIAKGQQVQGNGETRPSQLNLTQDMKRAMQLLASGDWELPSGLLLVAKVFPGYTKCINNVDVTLAKASRSNSIKTQDYTGIQSLQVTHGGAATSKQKVYYVFDGALVLPEYFVEYHNDEDTVNHGMASRQVDSFERKYRIRRSISPQLPGNSITDDRILRLLQMEPLLSGSETMIAPSARLQLAITSRIKYLSLVGCDLDAIPDLSYLKDHLEVLVLSYNKIQATSNLEGLSKLITLDLSYNSIPYLEHLENLPNLETLEVTHNLIRSFDDVKRIGQALGKLSLKHLDLRKNGICESKRYRFHVLQSLPKLAQLDQQSVSQEEILTAQRLVTQLSPSKVWALHCQKSRCAASTSQSSNHPESDEEGDTKGEWSSVEDLVLNHELLGSIEGLSKAVNLRVASFSDNAIKRIDGLQVCTKLEELYLDDNEITKMENLDQLSFLKKLHLGRNKLSVIQHLDSLENLIQLSLEENQISSLRGLGSASKLMELYLANNRIENLKEIQHLKSLPKLTILDVSGNEIMRLPDYRLYSVFYLRRVKVLDGLSVSTQDQSNAKQKYSGKLTFELILEKCGGGGSVTPTRSGESQLGRILDMDVSSCRLREIGRISGDIFSNLREINLENNQISDISGLEALPRLRILNLNRNKIEKLTPSSSPSDYTIPDTCDGGGKGILACLHLEELHLAYNLITDMTTLGLQFLDSLKVLHLQGNAILYFAGLECNTELVDIRLDKNRIRQLDPESTLALRRVKFLNLEDNGLKSLSNFNNMLSLEAKEVEKLASLPSMVNLKLVNNPLTKKHLYRQHVLYKLNPLKTLDGKDVYSDEKERIEMLFAAAATASDRGMDNRPVYPSQLVLTPSSIPTKGSTSIGIPQPIGIYNEVLTGSHLRKTNSPLFSHGQMPTSAPSFPLPEHEVDLSISAGSSNVNSRSVLPTHNSYRNNTLGSQSSWQQLYAGSGMRRRITSVHYDQQSVSPSLQVSGKFGETKLPAGIVSSQAVGRSPAATIRRAGFNMQPSSVEAQENLLPVSSIPSSSNDASNRNFSGYVVTFGNQKRYPSYPETTIPYISTELQQQPKRNSERK
ncbi:uncharacterized protein PITG_07172 [Phytophthora infestans T30-4]|uniref:U2A'/phosphoprotein 32 family A C-terminal domain-containing protein n=1 Tax=Phytophthora infestans (strain T30-4) TaxID=403677 RepID=D0N7G3_PHYIT|nr:uncharacterized protein PITG_07172 [Phytophthora infestans T30-4]EEY53512.1 conserved hypothetical protein [Phytophthora infestans T30-4]|eukprot:XP_002905130.1 conserved hypothetical protein [Phytophthora infestans T30-4]